MAELPITAHLSSIAETLKKSPSNIAVLTAETAAGKSTAVPPFFLSAFPGRILMLEPRRVAALAIAERIAETLGERCGETVGYRMRLESRISRNTRIEIITEAILTRMIQNDPALTGVSVVILDEFHERSLHGDLALALLREVVTLRGDLRVLVMSATINAEKIAAILDSPVVSVPGRTWPVEIVHKASFQPRRIGDAVADAVLEELRETDSTGILCFLPGIADIRLAEQRLQDCGAEVAVLHGSLSFSEQKMALRNPDGKRRVILSSSIAETSLTVPGVSTVVDCGFARISRLDPRTGMTRLETEPESVFSAAQRAGRAGRTGPGRCVRLWAQQDLRVAETPPEIVRSDLIPLVLECAVWGARKAEDLQWIDPPNSGAWAASREILAAMGAIDESGAITERGKFLSSLGLHPRLAAVALAGGFEKAASLADRSGNPREKELALQDLKRRLAQVPARFFSAAASPSMSLLEGFPDRIARHQQDGLYKFPSGRVARLAGSDAASYAVFPEWIVAPDVDAGEREGRIYSCEILPSEEALRWIEAKASTETSIELSGSGPLANRKIRKVRRTFYGKLILREIQTQASPEDIPKAFCRLLRDEGIDILPWNQASRLFYARCRFLRHCRSGAVPSANELLEDPENWLVPFLDGSGNLAEQRFLEALRWRFDGAEVDWFVPLKIKLANGIERPLSWEESAAGALPTPVLETRVQDLYGCRSTPEILGEPIVLKLLSPARRPVQITRDLAGFWAGSWKEVRKDMKGRYPRHDWPENPAESAPLRSSRGPN